MINTLFISNKTGDLFFEKHWRSIIPRKVCDPFTRELGKVQHPGDIPPIIPAPNHIYLFNVFVNDLFFIAVVQKEVQPLFVFEFIHRVVDIFKEYFSKCTEETLKDNFLVCYELLEEMLDNGFPLTTETNVLKELIRPPSYVRTVLNTVTGKSNVSGVLPTGQLSNVPWRKVGVKYSANEIYFDIVEEIDCILESNGQVVSCDISGEIQCLCHLSGMPDLTLSFFNANILDDLSFHPCVRFRRWETEKLLSFVPPDGPFKLASYHVNPQSFVQMPLQVTPMISFHGGDDSGGVTGRCQISVAASRAFANDKVIEDIKLTVNLPRSATGVSLIASSGSYMFDQNTKTLTWDIGKLAAGNGVGGGAGGMGGMGGSSIARSPPSLSGTITLAPGASVPEASPGIDVAFTMNHVVTSGLKVNRLDLFGERYKPYKGVKYVTKAGKFHNYLKEEKMLSNEYEESSLKTLYRASLPSVSLFSN
eukprot:Nk52_evm1s116 gene=Nk52_evmTU1s116